MIKVSSIKRSQQSLQSKMRMQNWNADKQKSDKMLETIKK